MLSSIRLIFTLIVDIYLGGSCIEKLIVIRSLFTWEIGTYLVYGNIIPYNILVGTAHCNKYLHEIVEKNYF